MPTRPRCDDSFSEWRWLATQIVVAQELPLRRIAPDVATGTSAAVVVDGSTALAQVRVQIYPIDISFGQGRSSGPSGRRSRPRRCSTGSSGSCTG